MATPDKKVEIRIETTSDQKGIKAAEKSINDLKKEASALQKDLNNASIGGQEFQRLSEEIGTVNKQISDAEAKHRDYVKSSGGMQSATKNNGQALLTLGRIVQDGQYGIGGMVNNIEGLTMSLGMGAGLAGVLTLVGVGLQLFTKKLQDAANMVDKDGKKFVSATELIKDFNEQLEAFAQLSVDERNRKFAEYANLGAQALVLANNELSKNISLKGQQLSADQKLAELQSKRDTAAIDARLATGQITKDQADQMKMAQDQAAIEREKENQISQAALALEAQKVEYQKLVNAAKEEKRILDERTAAMKENEKALDALIAKEKTYGKTFANFNALGPKEQTAARLAGTTVQPMNEAAEISRRQDQFEDDQKAVKGLQLNLESAQGAARTFDIDAAQATYEKAVQAANEQAQVLADTLLLQQQTSTANANEFAQKAQQALTNAEEAKTAAEAAGQRITSADERLIQLLQSLNTFTTDSIPDYKQVEKIGPLLTQIHASTSQFNTTTITGLNNLVTLYEGQQRQINQLQQTIKRIGGGG